MRNRLCLFLLFCSFLLTASAQVQFFPPLQQTIFVIEGSPEGRVSMDVGILLVDRNSGILWQKRTIRAVNTGWIDLSAGGGGGTVPTGTGFTHITAGAQDVASKLVDTADINNSQITYSKIQNVSATDKLLGRSTAGAGVIEEIALTAAGRALLDDSAASNQRTTLGLALGTDVQPYDADLGIVSVGFTADGAGAVIPTGKLKGFGVVRYNATITGWSLVVDTGTATVKCWKIASGTAKPTIANVINTAGVGISSGTVIESTTVTDFTSTTVTAGDIFAFDLTANSAATEISFQLMLTK